MDRPDFAPDPDFESVSKAPSFKGQTVIAPDEDSFSPDIHQDVVGLLKIGALSTVATIYGHRIEIHTLKSGEELARDQIVGEYEGQLGQSKALGLAQAAACVKSIDGTPLTRALGPNQSETISAIRANFDHFRNYYFPVIEEICDEFDQLELRQARAFAALKGKS